MALLVAQSPGRRPASRVDNIQRLPYTDTISMDALPRWLLEPPCTPNLPECQPIPSAVGASSLIRSHGRAPSIRPVLSEDTALLTEMFAGLSSHTQWLRFFRFLPDSAVIWHEATRVTGRETQLSAAYVATGLVHGQERACLLINPWRGCLSPESAAKARSATASESDRTLRHKATMEAERVYQQAGAFLRCQNDTKLPNAEASAVLRVRCIELRQPRSALVGPPPSAGCRTAR